MNFKIDVFNRGERRLAAILVALRDAFQPHLGWAQRGLVNGDDRRYPRHCCSESMVYCRVPQSLHHGMARLPFSFNTWFSNVTSYSPDKSGILRPKNPASKAHLAAVIKDERIGS